MFLSFVCVATGLDLDHADQLEQTDLLSPVEIGGYNRASVFYKNAYKYS